MSAFPQLHAGVDSREVFAALFDAYPDALLLVGGAGQIVLANPTADSLLGYEPGTLVGLSVDVLVPDATRPRHAQYREAYAKAPRARPMGTNMDLVAKRRDGIEVMVEIALSPLQQAGLPYTVVAIRGIGDYPRVKKALQRARYSESVATMGRLAVDTRDPLALLRQVPEVAVEALQVDSAFVALLEPSGTECRVAAGLGLLPGEAIDQRVPCGPGTPFGDVLAARERHALSDAERAAGITSVLSVPLSDLGRAVGLLCVRSRQAQRFGDDELHFLESLSNLLAATLQRVHTEEALQHAQRLESVGQLTGGIAHDFNNLLTVIQGNLQVLEECPPIADDAHTLALVAAAMRASRRAAELTSKLLAFSRRQVLSPSRVDAPSLVHSLADMLRRTLDQRIRIEVDAPPDCPLCLADSGQLETALLNVAINARDAMPDGGPLRFVCAAVDALPPSIGAEFSDDADLARGFVSIAISDSGAGMSAAVRERAFEPFFTTKALGRGTGLGLSTVYGFAKQSHGAVTLDSRPGAGTTVTLYLPQATHAAQRADVIGVESGALPAGLRVLLVEDEPEVRVVAQRFLEALQVEVLAFGCAEDALSAVERGASVDLLVTDIALGPGMRGTALAEALQTTRPALPVLLVSGFAEELLALSESAPLSWELLAKPYSRAELCAGMLRALAANASG